MSKFELHKVGFINPLDLTQTVVLSTILEGAGGATRAFIEEEPTSYIMEDNQEIKDGQVFTFTMAGKPTLDKAQFVSWAATQTKLTIVGYAYEEVLIIENAVITFLPNLSERLSWVITAKKEGQIGYKANGKLATEVMMSKNMLNMYYFQEGTTANMIAGWSKSGGVTLWDAVNKTMTYSTTGAASVYAFRIIHFPFTKQITFSVTVTDITVTTGVGIEIRFYDNTGTVIMSPSAPITTTGIAFITKVVPPDAVRVGIQIRINQNDSITFKDAALNLGTSTTYIPQ